MKFIATLIITVFIGISAFPQSLEIEKSFEKNKRTFSLTKFSEGEDASSGWDYLVYRKKLSTKKIRVIWSNYQSASVEDYFYELGKPVLYVKYAAKRNQYKTLVKGTSLPLKAEERLYFTDSKLVSWFENGKEIPKTDSRWAEKEKEVLEAFEQQLENFRLHLRGEM